MLTNNEPIPDLYDEEELVMISALQHFLFCPRQCALIHIEQLWLENRFTAEGRILHERVHAGGRESRKRQRIAYDLPIRSLRLGVIGRADMVEFHLQKDGNWQPLPVEFKRGRPKTNDTDQVQLCAQALCLEEMLICSVPEGALYYGEKKRRTAITFTKDLRKKTEQTAAAVKTLIASGKTPAPIFGTYCKSCSFVSLCLPQITTKKLTSSYLKKMVPV